MQLYSINMILNSFEINKVLFNILDFLTLMHHCNDNGSPGILFTDT